MAPKIAPSKKRKKGKKEITSGKIYIQSTFNNTIVSITDLEGKVIAWGSGGTAGFKGTRKSTPYAAGKVALQVAEKAHRLGLKEAEVYVKGIGSGRESAIRSLITVGINITKISDVTPIPHNGPRPKKPRRV